MGWPYSCLHSGNSASNSLSPNNLFCMDLPVTEKSNIPGSHINERIQTFEHEFVSLVTFLTFDSVSDQNLQGNHLLRPSLALFHLESCLAYLRGLVEATWKSYDFELFKNYKFTLVIFVCLFLHSLCAPRGIELTRVDKERQMNEWMNEWYSKVQCGKSK